MSFRVVTYNIHKGIGGIDRRYRLERVIETLKHFDADIVCLQEVDDRVPRSKHDEQAEVLSEALALPHIAFQRNVKLKQGAYGNAILSRYPLSDITHVDLTVPLKKRRRALLAHCRLHVDGHRRTVLLACLHLGLAGFERQIQLRRLMQHPLLKHTTSLSSVILSGDYNDVWGRLGKRVMLPAGYRSVSRSTRTFPAVMPLRSLDRIFYRGPLHSKHTFAGHTKVARQASDHLPLVADFEFETP
ncbi:MAG: endonuclease [Planctomycetes bacterium]|nr:endonuclease [Planctomycetota bacterium]